VLAHAGSCTAARGRNSREQSSVVGVYDSGGKTSYVHRVESR
jgi:hypothetical protein